MADSTTALTPAERSALRKLIEAWNEFVSLPVEHPDATGEFRQGIHLLQCQILARPTLRSLAEEEGQL